MQIRLVSGDPSEPLPPRLLERYDPAEWSGRDGRTASIIWLR
jgi:hypothetical protein